jgi:integrase
VSPRAKSASTIYATYASELLRRGIPLKTVSQRLGHANPTVTLDIYAHVMSGDDEKAAKTTDDIYKKRSKKKVKEEGKMNLTFARDRKLPFSSR